jgi:hypothetical protein
MTDGLIRGRMTPQEKAQIDQLAGSLRRPTPSAIARRLKRHPSTVNWYMITRGLVDRSVTYGRQRASVRRGRALNPYTPQHDRRLVELRRSGVRFRAIAETLTREFGVPRKPHSVRIRAIMLAAYDGGPEE